MNNGKYELIRLRFGLKYAPSLFQRALDDTLRDYIGKICFLYIDDIIIFSKDNETHARNFDTIFRTLQEANMKCELGKGVETNPDKIAAIDKYSIPRTLEVLRSFIGPSIYYRRFIKDFAKLA